MAVLDQRFDANPSPAAPTLHASWWKDAFPKQRFRAWLRLQRCRRRRALLARTIAFERFDGSPRTPGQRESELFFARLVQAMLAR
ncbi:hypothetical protein [Devosia nitrariae]|uniref:Uncharacterized protein n=1 Tax=Devosia nitrariae TaxID=2071872 RepID=A0ABQ5WB92_9HYPH|nr:hypothetical protein [Devosia nitrariae]GLQ57210.1 hypothetical protein GCM10010862_44690 [Devosia nitrariae]